MIDVNVKDASLHRTSDDAAFTERDYGHNKCLRKGLLLDLCQEDRIWRRTMRPNPMSYLTNALAEELKLLGSHAQVHALCPGPVNTGSTMLQT